MEYMTSEDLAAWLRAHKGERGRKPFEQSIRVETGKDEVGDPEYGYRRQQIGVTITANDGATISLQRNPEQGPGLPEYISHERMDPEDPSLKPSTRTPAQSRSDEAAATAAEQKNTEEAQLRTEKEYNARTPDEFGVTAYETNADRATRVSAERVKRRQEQEVIDARAREEADRVRRAKLDQDTLESQAAGRALTASEGAAGRAATHQEGEANRALTQAQIDETRKQHEYERNKPNFLSDANANNSQIVQYDPASNSITSVANPNYDAVKAAAEEKRKELASQIAAGQLRLEEAKQQYTQWFDTNVRVPIMQSQEARARAEEKRAALEAEERRKQFAANFGLQKAQLGQQAGQAAVQNEISLLPYRSGPTWGADFSDAVNGLAGGGSMGANAASGIHFSDSSFAFNRPDFKSIAKSAAKAALSGLTDYRPAEGNFETGDYSQVPAINTSGMPAYTGISSSLPAPSPGAATAGEVQ